MSHNKTAPYQEVIFIVYCKHGNRLTNVSQMWCRKCECLKQSDPFALVTVSVGEHGLPEVTVFYKPEWTQAACEGQQVIDGPSKDV